MKRSYQGQKKFVKWLMISDQTLTIYRGIRMRNLMMKNFNYQRMKRSSMTTRMKVRLISTKMTMNQEARAEMKYRMKNITKTLPNPQIRTQQRMKLKKLMIIKLKIQINDQDIRDDPETHQCSMQLRQRNVWFN